MDQRYTHKIKKIEEALNYWLPVTPDSKWAEKIFPGLADTLDTQLLHVLTVPGRDLISRGGKRWRPLLMILVCEALGGGEAAMPLVPLFEFSHNASLIHDDIEDNADERRGKPAVHIVHGTDAAINSGSFLYFLSLACIDSWAESLPQDKADSYRSSVYSLWSANLRKLHLGQAIDIHWHRDYSIIPSLDKYHTMCRLKTGCLARFAAELGAAIAELSIKGKINPVPMQQLGIAGEKLGVGFQILDDVKNLTTGVPGKKRGDDIVEGKKSLPLLLFLHRYPEKRVMVFRSFESARSGGAGVPEVEKLIQAFEGTGILAEAEGHGKSLIAEANDIFNSADIPLSDEGRALLHGLIDLIG